DRARIPLAHGLQQLDPVDTRHPDVGHEHVDRHLLQALERPLTPEREAHVPLLPVRAQQTLEPGKDVGLVVDEQELHQASSAAGATPEMGSRKVKVVPEATTDSNVNVP